MLIKLGLRTLLITLGSNGNHGLSQPHWQTLRESPGLQSHDPHLHGKRSFKWNVTRRVCQDCVKQWPSHHPPLSPKWSERIWTMPRLNPQVKALFRGKIQDDLSVRSLAEPLLNLKSMWSHRFPKLSHLIHYRLWTSFTRTHTPPVVSRSISSDRLHSLGNNSPPRRRDELWGAFRALDSEFHK